MQRLRDSLVLRYVVAIFVTAALMIWISVNEEGSGPHIPAQIVFWSVAVTAGWLQMIVIARGLRDALGPDRWPGWALLIATALAGAVPLTFEIRWLLDLIVAPDGGLPPAWLTYVNVTVINLVFCLVQYILIERWPLFDDRVSPSPKPTTGQSLSAPAAPFVGLLSRRPDGLSGTIRFMRMEDHYLHVFTDEGDGMVLHRMSDACQDLDGTDGRQVHKSWWVSRAAIADVRQDNRRRIIVLKDGAEVPVGRSFEPALRTEGWI